MSTTQYTATAQLQVAHDFDLHSFLWNLKKKCIDEENFIVDDWGFTDDGDLDIHFEWYATRCEDTITICYDTVEANSNSDIFDWLFDEFLAVMQSRYAVVIGSVADTDDGIKTDVEFWDKDKNCMTALQLLDKYIVLADQQETNA